jgi:hypothetical protein
MRTLILLTMVCFSASIALAGEIFGTISESGKLVPAEVKVEIAVSEKQYAGETDKFGAYSVYVKEKGKATLTVYFKDQKPTAEVLSFDRSTRYDWNIEVVDGKMTLKRK